MEYDRLNRSELATIAQELDAEAHRFLSRDILIRVIEGEQPPLPERTINKRRLQVMNYVNENWDQVMYQVSCPAKSRDPRACFNCCDVQAIECISLNTDKIGRE